jgi:hypothetical protein
MRLIMATGTETKDPRRDPDTEVAMPAAGIPLLAQYERIIGKTLTKLHKDNATVMPQTKGLWFWSWTPEQVGLFLSNWDSQIYVAHPLLKDLAWTPDPGGGGLMYERFCKPEITAAIKKIQIMYHKPLSAITAVPKGNSSVDLRPAPPNMRSGVFTIGNISFSGLVTGIDRRLRDQLAYMHSRYCGEGYRIMQAMDHGTQDLGEVRA